VVGCDFAIFGVGPRARNWKEQAVVVGPVAFVGLRLQTDKKQFQPVQGEYQPVKVPLQIGPDPVTLRVVPSDRNYLSLLYDRAKWKDSGLYSVSDGDVETTFVPCRDEKTTTFAGGLIVVGPRCASVDLYIGNAQVPRRVDLPFGLRNCSG
jgi:hypothetical protein